MPVRTISNVGRVRGADRHAWILGCARSRFEQLSEQGCEAAADVITIDCRGRHHVDHSPLEIPKFRFLLS